MKNRVEGIKSRLDEAEDQISELEDKLKKKFLDRTTKQKKDSKRMQRELQDNRKCNNIYIIGIQEGAEKEQGKENLYVKVMTENFPNLMTEKNHTSTGSAEGPNQDESK